MKLVVITRPDFFEGETDIVNDLSVPVWSGCI